MFYFIRVLWFLIYLLNFKNELYVTSWHSWQDYREEACIECFLHYSFQDLIKLMPVRNGSGTFLSVLRQKWQLSKHSVFHFSVIILFYMILCWIIMFIIFSHYSLYTSAELATEAYQGSTSLSRYYIEMNFSWNLTWFQTVLCNISQFIYLAFTLEQLS